MKHKYKVRKIDIGMGYKFAVTYDGNIMDTFLSINDCLAYILLHENDCIDEEYNSILPKDYGKKIETI